MVAGAVITASAQQQQAAAQKASADFNSAVARNNATVAQNAAADAEARGKVEAQRQQLRTRGAIGAARADAAARGVLANTGSALDIQADIAGVGKEEELLIRNNARREALGFQTQAADFTARSQLFTLEGNSAVRAGRLASAGTLLSSAGGVGAKFLNKIPSSAPGRIPSPNTGNVVA